MSFNKLEEENLMQVNTWQVIKAQLQLKWRMSHGVFMMLLLVQLLGILMSIGNTMGFSSYGHSDTLLVDISLSQYVGEAMIVFPTLSLIGLAFSYSFSSVKNMMASYITNQRITLWTNMLFLLFLSIVLGVVTHCLAFTFKMIIFQVHGTEGLLYAAVPTIGQFLIAVCATILYMFLGSVLAYLMGEIFQVSKVLFIVLFIFLSILLGNYDGTWISGIHEVVDQFLFKENRISIFFIKVVSIVALLYGCILALTNKQEVR